LFARLKGTKVNFTAITIASIEMSGLVCRDEEKTEI